LKPKKIEELEDICDYCPTTFGYSAETLCEGCCCEQAYEKYLDQFESEDDI
jgi:hypothetical protein